MSNILVVEKFLSDELSLSKKEVILYLNLIKYGGMTVLELSELSNINRATTHVNMASSAGTPEMLHCVPLALAR